MHKKPRMHWLMSLMIVALAAGCLSPHGGLRLPFARESKPPRTDIYGGDGRTYDTAFQVHRLERVALEDLEDNVVYRDTYGWRFYMNQEHIAPTEAQFKQTATRVRQRVGKEIYDEVTFTGATGQKERRYFDITNVVYK